MTDPCAHCHKSTLSLLLLRPSPIADLPELAPKPAAGGALPDAAAVVGLDGVVPSRLPTQSRLGLRLLREGYVHVYIPSPPRRMPSWLIYRVTSHADLVPDDSALFQQTGVDVSCHKKGHNPAGLKLLSLPNPHLLGTVWIAYSANLWSDRLRARNAANPKAMQKVVLAECGVHEFKPTAAALRQGVLECSVTAQGYGDGKNSDFPFASLVGEVDVLAEQLQRAAACSPRTKGWEKAVVLRDPAGLAAELNALRVQRQKLALAQIAAERAKPENEHPLNSADTMEAVHQYIVEGDLEHAFVRRTQHNIMTREQFVQMESQVNPIVYTNGPPEWIPLENTPENIRAYGPNKGIRTIPGYEQELNAYAMAQSRHSWDTMTERFFDEPKCQKWIADFDARMQKQYADPVMAWEADWWSVREDASFADYFALHFDEADPNDPRAFQSPGLAYAGEVSRALTPAPMTHGPVLDAYLAEVTKLPDDPTALLPRALVGNQKELIAQAKEILEAPIKSAGTFSHTLTPEQTGLLHGLGNDSQHPFAYLKSERFDKLYDFFKAFREQALETKYPNAVQKTFQKYSWLSSAWADMMCKYGVSVWTGMMAASTAGYVFRGLQWGLKTERGKQLTERALNSAMLQRTLERVFFMTMRGGKPVVPMLIRVDYPVAEASRRLNARGIHPRLMAGRVAPGGDTISLYLLTDSEELGRYNNDIDKAIELSAGHLSVGGVATGGVAAAAGSVFKYRSGELPGVISRETFENLWRARKVLAETSSAWMATTDGRLAVGGLLVNLFAIKKSIGEIREEQIGTPEEQFRKKTTAVLGLLDAIGCELGAGVEMYSVLSRENISEAAFKKAFAAGKNAHEATEAAEDAVAESAKMAWLRFGGSIFGMVSGIFAVVGSFRKVQDAITAGQNDVAHLYTASMISFGGTIAVPALTGVGALAEAILKSEVQNALGRAVLRVVSKEALGRTAALFGAEGTANLAGVSIPGIGWIFVGLSLGFEAWAFMRTPTDLQIWVSRSYFGKSTGTDTAHAPFPKGQWKVEYDAFLKALAPPKKEGEEAKAEDKKREGEGEHHAR